jgi:hypothetical protein
VLQGWVPRVTGSARARRAGTALLIAAGFAIAVGAAMIVVTPALMGWLGNGQISVSWDVVLLVAACGTLNSFVRSMELVALAPFGRLHIAARAIIVSFVGLPTVALGAMMLGTIGALSGVLVCLLICALIESTDYVRSVRPLSRDAFQSPLQ